MSKAAFLPICFSWSCLCFLRDVIFRYASATGDQLIQRLFDPTEWKCYRKSVYRCFPASASKWKHHLHSARLRISGSLLLERGRGGGGEKAVLPYESDGGVRRKISRTPLKGTRILFYGPKFVSTPKRYQFNNDKIYNWHCKFWQQ